MTRRRGDADIRRAVAHWRKVTVVERQLAATEYRRRAAAAPVDLVIRPCEAHPDGTVVHPRANLLDAAHRSHVAAITWAAHADLVEYRWAGGVVEVYRLGDRVPV